MKRLMDILGSLIGLILFAPVILLLFILIRRDMGSPVFFRQKRPGKDSKLFNMIKFRSMRDAIGADGGALPDAERLTSLGRKMRATSLDELPGLWNVLMGDMSLVGPRPLLVEYLPLYSTEQARRHEVRPGVTGWAQINGRNALSWEEKFTLDVWYVDNRTFWLDLKIIALTVKKVLVRDGISADGEATMQKFSGKPMTGLVLIGAGGHGKVVADIAEACGYSDIIFTDQSWPKRQQNGRWPIVAAGQDGLRFCAIGNNTTRARVFAEQELENSPVLIHPSAVISPTAQLGAGTLVVAGVVVNADVKTGVGVILNTGCSVDHDCKLGDFVHVSPGARLAGGVNVGPRSWIGIGAVVKEGVTIGQNVVVAAGAAVVQDVEDGARVGGVPAVTI